MRWVLSLGACATVARRGHRLRRVGRARQGGNANALEADKATLRRRRAEAIAAIDQDKAEAKRLVNSIAKTIVI